MRRSARIAPTRGWVRRRRGVGLEVPALPTAPLSLSATAERLLGRNKIEAVKLQERTPRGPARAPTTGTTAAHRGALQAPHPATVTHLVAPLIARHGRPPLHTLHSTHQVRCSPGQTGHPRPRRPCPRPHHRPRGRARPPTLPAQPPTAPTAPTPHATTPHHQQPPTAPTPG